MRTKKENERIKCWFEAVLLALQQLSLSERRRGDTGTGF